MEIGNIYEILGTTGSLIMCVSSIPQIIKTYRTKSADSLSGSYLAILIMGMLLILSYALYRKDIVFIFGQYSVGPYVFGIQEFSIPKSSINNSISEKFK